MPTLALAVDADDELWTLDDLPPPEAPYVEVGSELIEVRSRFPSQTYTLTGETLPPKIRVRRGIAGTTKASHIQGSTLTPNYGLGSGGGGVAIAVDNTVDAPVEVSSIVAAGATFVGDEATLRGKDFYAQDDDPGVVGAGSRWIDTSASPAQWFRRNDADTAWEPNADIITVATGAVQASSRPSAFTEDGNASVSLDAESTGSGAATADSLAYAQGSGTASARPTAITDGAGNANASPHATTDGGGNAIAQPWAEAAGTGDAESGTLATAVSGSAIAISKAETTTGEAQNGIRATRGATEASLLVTVLGDDSTKIVALGLPTADPANAGELWEDAGLVRTGGMTIPEVPAAPTAQNVVDALVALGLITQAV